MTDERRRSRRYPVNVPAQVIIEGAVRDGRVRDLCKDALFVEMDGEWPLDTGASLTVSLPGSDDPLEVAGRIVRFSKGGDEAAGLAVLFTQVSPAAATQIDFFLEGQDSKELP